MCSVHFGNIWYIMVQKPCKSIWLWFALPSDHLDFVIPIGVSEGAGADKVHFALVRLVAPPEELVAPAEELQLNEFQFERHLI